MTSPDEETMMEGDPAPQVSAEPVTGGRDCLDDCGGGGDLGRIYGMHGGGKGNRVHTFALPRDARYGPDGKLTLHEYIGSLPDRKWT